MSDFLTRLTERVRPGKMVLRPVLPSRFEQVSTTDPWESVDPFSVVDAEAHPPAAGSNLNDHAAPISSPIHSTHAVESQHQDPTAHVIAQTAKTSLETGKPFARSERALPRREADQATFLTQKIPPAENTPLPGLSSSPLDKRRINPAKQETASRLVVREPSIEQEHAVTVQADRWAERPEDQNLPANRASKPPRELSLTDESRIQVRQRESFPIEPRVKGQLPHEAKTAFLSSRLDPPQPEQGALRPLRANSTHQRVSGDSAATFESRPFASPEIRVTIGRIEVRAIVAPSGSPRPQTPRAPQSSLDDYLRSRKEALA
jgi:hypothetical protein